MLAPGKEGGDPAFLRLCSWGIPKGGKKKKEKEKCHTLIQGERKGGMAIIHTHNRGATAAEEKERVAFPMWLEKKEGEEKIADQVVPAGKKKKNAKYPKKERRTPSPPRVWREEKEKHN